MTARPVLFGLLVCACLGTAVPAHAQEDKAAEMINLIGWLQEPIRLLTQPESRTGFEGGTVGFSVTADGAPPLRYQWLLNRVRFYVGKIVWNRADFDLNFGSSLTICGTECRCGFECRRKPSAITFRPADSG